MYIRYSVVKCVSLVRNIGGRESEKKSKKSKKEKEKKRKKKVETKSMKICLSGNKKVATTFPIYN